MPARRTVSPKPRRLIDALAAQQKLGGWSDQAFCECVQIGTDKAGERVYLTATQWSRLKLGKARLTWQVGEGLVRQYPQFAGELFADFWGGLLARSDAIQPPKEPPVVTLRLRRARNETTNADA